MIGWRGRIGLIVPSSNTISEYEFNKVIPEGFSVHTARIFYRPVTDPKEKVQALLELIEGTSEAAGRIASINPAVIGFTCTSGSFIKGKGHDKEIIDRIEKETGIPAVSASNAVLEAFKTLNIKRITMVTPYIEVLAEKEEEFFEEIIPGFKVINKKNLGIVSSLAKGDLYPSAPYIHAKEVDSSEADAVFISCAGWRTIEIIELLEKDLGKPVISSNLATMWAVFKKMNISDIEGYGRLLRDL